ncbi:hypothetical protein C5Y96_07915 [Blastopirellula marina]|uniref:GYF domain-containing protein n=1 Tax=Blastopirellula marina TaxID=124 RepID=A0A2S8FYW6_9BACT|nr:MULTISPECIES: DUF4282 domain-containing protein [Pirellulaceae]PQO37074.1 hypothetical protein C5Y96_07915 [Blastopirellula marina]RCS53789.1 DUF4282 domain-containing protein [Bremerella cremea]
MADEFFYKFNPDAPEVGPIDSKTLKQLAGSGAIQPESLLRRGTGEWITASTVKGLFPSGSASPPEAIPVAPPAGTVPIATPVTAAPVTSASPPEAIPVAPPAADTGGGLSFPDLAQSKPAADVPAGLDSLVVAPKKPGGKPAKKGSHATAKKAAPAPATPKIEVPKAEAPKAEAPKIEVPKAEPVAVPMAAAPVVAAPTAVKPVAEAPNPYAADPPAGRSKARRKGSGGLGSLFNFDVMIAPTVIKTLFFLISGLIFLVYLAITALSLVSAILTGELLAIAGAAGIAIVGFLVVLIYIVILRVSAEVSLVFFTINDNVRDMRDMMAERQGTID